MDVTTLKGDWGAEQEDLISSCYLCGPYHGSLQSQKKKKEKMFHLLVKSFRFDFLFDILLLFVMPSLPSYWNKLNKLGLHRK